MKDKPSSIERNKKASIGGVLEEIRKKPSLLECIRLKLIEVEEPTTYEEQREKMELIIEHQSKFPSRLRPAISEAANDQSHPSIFLSEVYKAVAAFFFGEPHRVEDHDEDEEDPTALKSHWWKGPDIHVDTNEELEVAIRLFPKVLNENYRNALFPSRRGQISPSMRGCHPIYLLMTCTKAMPFVPLLAELGDELGRFSKRQRGGLGISFRGVLFQLAHGTIRRDEFDGDHPGKLDEVCTEIMVRLKKTGLMQKEDIYKHNLVRLLLYHAVQNNKSVIEKRFRFLINWDRYILLECARSTTLLDQFVRRHATTNINNDGEMPPHVLQIFRLIVEYGMIHFPAELGFIFHGRTFQCACKNFQTEVIKEVIDDEISNALEQKKNTQQNMVLSAASNDNVCLDGLYALFRRDPVALLSKTSTVR